MAPWGWQSNYVLTIEPPTCQMNCPLCPSILYIYALHTAAQNRGTTSKTCNPSVPANHLFESDATECNTKTVCSSDSDIIPINNSYLSRQTPACLSVYTRETVVYVEHAISNGVGVVCCVHSGSGSFYQLMIVIGIRIEVQSYAYERVFRHRMTSLWNVNANSRCDRSAK